MRPELRVLLGCMTWIAVGILFIIYFLPWVREIGPEHHHEDVLVQAVSPDASWSVSILRTGTQNCVYVYAEVRDKGGSLRLKKFLRQYDAWNDMDSDVTNAVLTNEECRIGNSKTNSWLFEIKKEQVF